MDDSLLLKYIGREWNAQTKVQIEDEFKSYRVKICNTLAFHRENFINNTIRCILVNNRIFNMSFN